MTRLGQSHARKNYLTDCKCQICHSARAKGDLQSNQTYLINIMIYNAGEIVLTEQAIITTNQLSSLGAEL